MELRVQFTKRPDGNVILRCTRRDDSVTWQRYDKQAAFFSHHDLCHFAVETVLGLQDGFYGLIADGWDITEMDGKGPRGKLPYQAALAEHIVGLLSQERMGCAERHSAEEFNAQIEELSGRRMENRLSDSQLSAVRVRISSLLRDWSATRPGATLHLTFDRSSKAFVEPEHAL